MHRNSFNIKIYNNNSAIKYKKMMMMMIIIKKEKLIMYRVFKTKIRTYIQ